MPIETTATETTTPAQDAPAPTPAHVPIEVAGTWNVRDVGGRAVPDGSSEPLRTGVLLRTASLSGLTDAGTRVLADRGVTTVLDLRSDQEVERDGADVVPAGAAVVRLPFGTPQRPEGFPEDETADLASLLVRLAGTAEPEAVGRAVMTHVYQGFVSDPAAHVAVSGALRALAEADGAVVVHCSAGKDRTGWVVALVQLVCGVPEQDVLAEYLLSADATAHLAAAMPALPGVAPEVWDAVLTVRPDYLEQALARARETYGTLEGYLDAIGAGADVRDAVRARFVANSQVSA